jgi:ABC-type arginine transport system permease subunit
MDFKNRIQTTNVDISEILTCLMTLSFIMKGYLARFQLGDLDSGSEGTCESVVKQ